MGSEMCIRDRSDPNDKRRKFLDVTEKGHKYICDLNESIDAIGK